MRRSARAVKKPVTYTDTPDDDEEETVPAIKNAVIPVVAGHDTDEEEQSGGDSDDDAVPAIVKKTKGTMPIAKSTKIIKVAPVAKPEKKRKLSPSISNQNKKRSAKRVSIQEDEDEENLSEQGENEFGASQEKAKANESDAVQKKAGSKGIKSAGNVFFDCLQSGRKSTPALEDWIARYSKDRVKCNADMLNFVLLAAGSEKSWIRSEVDVEALDTEEILELLTDMVQAMTAREASSVFPLTAATTSRQKATLSFKDKFVLFWESFPNTLISGSDGTENVMSSIEILKSISSILTSLSAMPLRNVRYAISVALLTIAKSIQKLIVNFKSKVDLTNRQLHAESKQSHKGAKFAAIERQKAEYDTTIEVLSGISEELFNAIFVHRYKDSADNIRALCAAHLGEWLPIDPGTHFRDEFLKYLGWMCSDRSASVRLQTVQSISALLHVDAQHLSKLLNFIERFAERFVEMSVGDVDDNVTLETLKMLRTMQQKELLDEALSEDQLDVIDQTAFDPKAPLATRREALGFMFDHTEGFDSNGTAVVGGGDEADDMTRRQQVALQLETIAEFIEHHLGAVPGSADMFVEACMGLPQAAILKDWQAITALLLKDSDDPSMLTLTPAHSAILIRIFVESAKFLSKGQYSDMESRKVPSVDWETFTESIHESLPRILTRYKDSDVNLCALIDLLKCYDAMSVNQKHFKPILKVVVELFESSTDARVITGIAASLRKISMEAEHLKVTIDSAISGLLKHVWERVTTETAQLSASSSGSATGSKKSKGGKQEEALFALSLSFLRLAALWQHIDCRPLLAVTVSELFDEIVEAAEAVVREARRHAKDGALLHTVSAGCRAAAKVMYSVLLWSTRDVYLRAKTLFERHVAGAVDEAETDVAAAIEVIVDLREKLLDGLHTWLEVSVSVDDSCDISTLCADLNLEAFRMIGDLRVLFSSRNNGYAIVNSLSWSPSQELLSSMRNVFDTEGSKITDELVSLGDSEEEVVAGRNLSSQLCSSLLCPMGIATIYNIDSLNRRQAAAVLCHLADGNERTQDLMKVWVKRLKDFDPVKYLEVQMVALKSKFSELILGPLQRADEDDELDAMKVIKEGYAALELISGKFSQTFGVSKFKNDLLSAAVNFLRVGIDFCLSESANIGFVKTLASYLRFLPAQELMGVSQYLEERLSACEQVLEELEDERNASIEIRALASFRATVAGTRGSIRRRRSSVSTTDSFAERQPPAKKPVARLSSLSRSVSVRGKESYALDTVMEQEEEEEQQEGQMLEGEDQAEDEEEEEEEVVVPVRAKRGRGAVAAVEKVAAKRGRKPAAIVHAEEAEEEMKEEVAAAPSARGRVPEKKTAELAAVLPQNDDLWMQDTSALSSSVKRKYTSRTIDERSPSKSRRSESESETRSPAKRSVPSVVLGLHLENIDVSPIASDEPVVEKAKASKKPAGKSSKAAKAEEDEEVTEEKQGNVGGDVDDMFLQMKMSTSRRRR